VEQSKCKVCGGNITCTIKRADLHFYIDENGNVRQDNNPDLWEYDPVWFHCENGREHEIDIDLLWRDQFLERVYKLL
jgi:hypothetical protein